MADKRDFYEVMGVPKNATEDEIKKPTANWQNITRISIRGTKRRRQNLKKSMRRMRYSRTKIKGPGTTSSAMPGWTPTGGGAGGSPFTGDIDLGIFSTAFWRLWRRAPRHPNAPRRGSDTEESSTSASRKLQKVVKNHILQQKIESCRTAAAQAPRREPVQHPALSVAARDKYVSTSVRRLAWYRPRGPVTAAAVLAA